MLLRILQIQARYIAIRTFAYVHVFYLIKRCNYNYLCIVYVICIQTRTLPFNTRIVRVCVRYALMCVLYACAYAYAYVALEHTRIVRVLYAYTHMTLKHAYRTCIVRVYVRYAQTRVSYAYRTRIRTLKHAYLTRMRTLPFNTRMRDAYTYAQTRVTVTRIRQCLFVVCFSTRRLSFVRTSRQRGFVYHCLFGVRFWANPTTTFVMLVSGRVFIYLRSHCVTRLNPREIVRVSNTKHVFLLVVCFYLFLLLLLNVGGQMGQCGPFTTSERIV